MSTFTFDFNVDLFFTSRKATGEGGGKDPYRH